MQYLILQAVGLQLRQFAAADSKLCFESMIYIITAEMERKGQKTARKRIFQFRKKYRAIFDDLYYNIMRNPAETGGLQNVLRVKTIARRRIISGRKRNG